MDKPMRRENSLGKIYFLRSAKNSANLIEAFNSLSRERFLPEWITRKNVKILAVQQPGAILVVDSIDSIEFSKIRKICKKATDDRGLALRIFSAFALLSINPRRIEYLPQSAYPIASTCMKPLHVSISGVSSKRHRELSRKVISMGGIYQESLMRSTQVLVTTSWDSPKALTWRKSDIVEQVVTPEWVDRCYEMREDIKDAYSVIDKYRLPIFHGMKFCVSGFHSSERKRMYRIIEDNGGAYSQALILPSYKFDGEQTQTRSQIDQSGEPLTTHLIVLNKEGPKYESAMALPADQIHIVNDDWFKVSWSKNYPQVEADPRYSARDALVMEKLRQKALQKKQRAVLSCTLNSDVSFMDGQPSISRDITNNSPPVIEKIIEDIENMLTSPTPIDCVQLFKDLSFYICGITKSQQNTVKKIISRHGGHVYPVLVNLVTHVVIGPTINSKEALSINRINENRPVSKVSVEWVLRCIKNKTLDIPESLDPVSAKLLGRINATQDLDPIERQEIARERAQPKADEMNAKFAELEASSDHRNNNNKNVNKKGLRIGGTKPHSPFRITKKPQNDSISCSIPVDYDHNR